MQHDNHSSGKFQTIDFDISENLVRKVKSGDASAFEALYQLYFKQQQTFISGIVKDEESALELTQETFIRAFESIDSLKDPCSFPKWLSQISYSMCMNWLNKHKPSLCSPIEVIEDDFPQLFTNEDPYSDPELNLFDSERQKTVFECIMNLSAEHRAALLYFYYEELNAKEIAQIMGISTGAVYKRLHDARTALKTQIKKLPHDQQYGLRSAHSSLLIGVFADMLHSNTATHAPEVVFSNIQASINLTPTSSYGFVSENVSASQAAGVSLKTPGAFSIKALGLGVAAVALIGIGVTLAFNVPELTQLGFAKINQDGNSAVPEQDEAPKEESAPVIVPQEKNQEAPEIKNSEDADSKATPPPEIYVDQASLHYSLGEFVSQQHIEEAAGIKALDAAGEQIPFTISNYDAIDFDHAGSYIIYVKASDSQNQAAETKIITVTVV